MPPSNEPLVEQLLQQLDATTSTLRAHASEADRLTQLPEAVVHELRTLGLFKLWVPQRYAGAELTLPETLRIYEAAGRVDGSIGWAVMIGAGGGLFAAWLDPVIACALYESHAAVIAGSGAPTGRAEHIDGGYRVTGRWRYASGAHYATTFTANCVLTRDDQPIIGVQGKPLIRAMAFQPDQVTIHQTWNTSGMRGTGSHDFSVADAVVPEQYTFSLYTDAVREAGPLYRLPFEVLTELPIAALSLGIARHALDTFKELAEIKHCPDGHTLVVAHPVTQASIARSDASWREHHDEIQALATRTWQVALEDRALTATQLAEINRSCVRCLADLRYAVFELTHLAGMNAVMQDNEFARAWRDLQTLAAHAAVSPLKFLS
jgi:indole-3-acetate monooxygenase